MGAMEGSIVLRPVDGSIEIPLGCIGIEAPATSGPLRGGWWFTFGADADQAIDAVHADAGLTEGITALRIVGLAPAALRSIAVQHGEALLFEMGSHVGITGHVSTAGEILRAMGQYRGGGGEGLLVELASATCACGWRALRVRLQVRLRVRASDRPDDASSKRAGLSVRVSLVAGGRAAARAWLPR